MSEQLDIIPFKGKSMHPILEDGDELYFTDSSSDLLLGDIVLFKDPQTSELIVHRVIDTNPIKTKGDWSCLSDELAVDNIFGKITGFKRKGESFNLVGNTFLISIYVYLSKVLLSKVRVFRKGARLLMCFLFPLLKKKRTGS